MLQLYTVKNFTFKLRNSMHHLITVPKHTACNVIEHTTLKV